MLTARPTIPTHAPTLGYLSIGTWVGAVNIIFYDREAVRLNLAMP
jgi:hypothetical protein